MRGESVVESDIAAGLPEQEILIQSVCETMVPKLVAEDIPLLFSLLSDVFPGIPYSRAAMTRLREEVRAVCDERFLCYSESEGEDGYQWVEKLLQLYQITNLNHGLMMVGPSGSGKSTAWRVLLEALERLEGVEGVAHVLDPKAISKDSLYGTLDPPLASGLTDSSPPPSAASSTTSAASSRSASGSFSTATWTPSGSRISTPSWTITDSSPYPTANDSPFRPTSASCSRSRTFATPLSPPSPAAAWSGSPRTSSAPRCATTTTSTLSDT